MGCSCSSSLSSPLLAAEHSDHTVAGPITETVSVHEPHTSAKSPPPVSSVLSSKSVPLPLVPVCGLSSSVGNCVGVTSRTTCPSEMNREEIHSIDFTCDFLHDNDIVSVFLPHIDPEMMINEFEQKIVTLHQQSVGNKMKEKEREILYKHRKLLIIYDHAVLNRKGKERKSLLDLGLDGEKIGQQKITILFSNNL